MAQTNPAVPVRKGEAPVVYGDDSFRGPIEKALDYLEAGFPDDYRSVCFWLTELRPTDTYTRVNRAGVCHVNGADAGASCCWLAGVLVHEAQHVADDDIYFVDHPYSDRESERRALTAQASYLGSVNGWTQEQTGSWVDGWLAKKYWETIPGKYSS